MRSAKSVLTVALVLLVLVGGGITVCHWVMNTLPVDDLALAKVKVGMSESQVRGLLGSPDSSSSVTEAGASCTMYRYSDSFRWTMVTVRFDNGLVSEIEVDR